MDGMLHPLKLLKLPAHHWPSCIRRVIATLTRAADSAVDKMLHLLKRLKAAQQPSREELVDLERVIMDSADNIYVPVRLEEQIQRLHGSDTEGAQALLQMFLEVRMQVCF